MVTIAVCGKPGAGSSSVARLLARKLGLRHVSGGDYFKNKAKESGIYDKETRTASAFLKSHKGGNKKFHEELDEMLKKEGRNGNVVIEGKLSIRMLKGIYDFSVWLEAADSVRAKRISGRDNLGEKEAIEVIKERDETERESFKKLYGFDTFSQRDEADMVVDTGDKTPEQITDMIISEMKKRNIL